MRLRGLLPAHAQGIVGVVHQDPEAVHHVTGDQVQRPGRRETGPAPQEQQGKPPQSKAGGKSHAQEDEKEGQGVAHVPGDHHIPAISARVCPATWTAEEKDFTLR